LITHKGEELMSNGRNEALVHETSFAFCAERLTKTFDRRRFVIASAGAIAASMVAPSRAFAAMNPVINRNGTASILSGQYCTWITAQGGSSTISIGNSSRANKLTIAISGAPGSGITVQFNGQIQPALNNIFTLPPNSPTSTIIATGNFGGTTLTITNITNKMNDAAANIQGITQ
jgi:hypothetical protein